MPERVWTWSFQSCQEIRVALYTAPNKGSIYPSATGCHLFRLQSCTTLDSYPVSFEKNSTKESQQWAQLTAMHAVDTCKCQKLRDVIFDWSKSVSQSFRDIPDYSAYCCCPAKNKGQELHQKLSQQNLLMFQPHQGSGYMIKPFL